MSCCENAPSVCVCVFLYRRLHTPFPSSELGWSWTPAWGDLTVHLYLQRTSIILADGGGKNKLNSYHSQVLTAKIYVNGDYNMEYVKQQTLEACSALGTLH